MDSRLHKRKLVSETNVVPLIDVMLVLLIVFMVTAPIITQSIKVDLPKADSMPVESNEDETLVVSIDAQGRYYINLGLTVEGNPQPLQLEQIGENVAKIMAANPTTPVYLEADASITHGVVTRLMSVLTIAGVPNIEIIAQPLGSDD